MKSNSRIFRQCDEVARDQRRMIQEVMGIEAVTSGVSLHLMGLL